jgi:hypothetical protein
MTAPAGAYPHAIWGHGSGSTVDLFALGGTAAWHYDGNSSDTWTKVTLPTLPSMTILWDLWGRSATEVYAVGTKGLIFQYDGKAWTKLTSPSSGDLTAVWGDATDLFALSLETGAVLRFDDKQQKWGLLGAPEGVTSRRLVQSVGAWAASTGEAFVVRGSAVIHHDGKAFKTMSVPTTAPLYDVAGGSASDVLAVGGAEEQAPTVLRYDGKAWTKQAAPSSSNPLLGVTGSGKSYHAVGLGSCSLGVCTGGGKVWRFDGAAWKAEITVPTAGWLAGIATCSSTRLAVVGSTHSGPGDPTNGKGVVALVDTATKGWTPATVAGVTHLLDVWCDASGTIVAVGGLLKSTTEFLPKPALYDLVTPKIVTCSGGSGLTCKVVDPPLRGRYHALVHGQHRGGLMGIWGSSSSELYAVGREGALLRYDGKAWKHLQADIRAAGHNRGCEDLLGIWGTKSELFVTTRSGAMRLERLP